MEIPDHIHILIQQLFQASSQQQVNIEIIINNQTICYQNTKQKEKSTPYQQLQKQSINWLDKIIEKVKNTFEKITIMVPIEKLAKENWNK
ncbi:hypothetical protein G9A89_022111 [Geosiphon pyriformis]|nr:hypothetical protein G9A89_022111 [Geosiphon pyriformis]